MLLFVSDPNCSAFPSSSDPPPFFVSSAQPVVCDGRLVAWPCTAALGSGRNVAPFSLRVPKLSVKGNNVRLRRYRNESNASPFKQEVTTTTLDSNCAYSYKLHLFFLVAAASKNAFLVCAWVEEVGFCLHWQRRLPLARPLWIQVGLLQVAEDHPLCSSSPPKEYLNDKRVKDLCFQTSNEITRVGFFTANNSYAYPPTFSGETNLMAHALLHYSQITSRPVRRFLIPQEMYEVIFANTGKVFVLA